MRRSWRAIVTLGLAVMFAVTCAAQNKKDKEDTTTRTLQGTVFSPEDQPVTGAVVQLKDMRTLQVKSFITQAEGAYHFSGLKTDVDYQVKADFSGLSSPTRNLTVFDNRKTAVINLKLEKK